MWSEFTRLYAYIIQYRYTSLHNPAQNVISVQWCTAVNAVSWFEGVPSSRARYSCNYFDGQANSSIKPFPRGRPGSNQNRPFKHTTEVNRWTERHGSAIYRTPRGKTWTWKQSWRKIPSILLLLLLRKVSRLFSPHWNGFLNLIISRDASPLPSDSSYFTLARQWGLCSLTKAFTAWLPPEIGRCATCLNTNATVPSGLFIL